MRCLILLLISLGIAEAQDFGKEATKKKMEGLSDLEKVQFINKNFYKLYSADFDHATALTQWAVETSMQNKWRSEEAYANLGLGVVTYLAGDYDAVLPHFFRSRHLFDSLQNKSGIAAINNEMAIFYHKQQKPEEAYHCLDVAEKVAREVNDLDQLGTTLGHRGMFLAIRQQFDEAEPYYREAYSIRLAKKDSVGLGYALAQLAEVIASQGNMAEAQRYLDQSTEIRKKIGDMQGAAVNSVNKGELYSNAKQYQQAATWFEKGLEEALEIGYTDLARFSYDQLAKTYKELNNYKKAYELQEKAVVYKDSLFNVSRTQVIEDLQSRYEAEKKDLQISQLNNENELKTATIQRNYFFFGGLGVIFLLTFFFYRYREKLKQKAIAQEQKVRLREAQINAVIDSQERERKRFASDLHDGMGQLVSALQLNIQSIKQNQDLEKTVSLVENSEHLLTDIQTEIRNIAFNLMPAILMKEGLFQAVRELTRRISKASSIQIELSIHDVPERLPDVVEVSVYRIIQELLSNIIKHSKASKITLSFTGYKEEVILTIEDNGNGYDLAKFQHSDNSHGWRTIQTRINLIKGEIEFDTMAGRKNSAVIINIPVNTLTSQETILKNT